MDSITEFQGVHEFLSNEFGTPVGLEGGVYPSVAHAFQAARTSDKDLRRQIAQVDLTQAYSLSEAIDNPADWTRTRVKVMERLIRDKFMRSKELQRRLLDTGSRAIINTYEDASQPSNLFWGVVQSKGQNQVGVILMQLRKDLEAGREVEAWLLSSFSMQTHPDELPLFRLVCYKHGHRSGSYTLTGKGFYLLGNSESCDVALAHPSISRRHACLLVDESLGPMLVDLYSKAGTFVQGTAVKQGEAVPVNSREELSFGDSTRVFRLEMDFSQVSEKLERRKRKIDEELEALERLEQGGDTQALKHLGLAESDTVRVQHLSYRCREEDLEELFAVCGAVRRVTLRKGRTSCSAEVQFQQNSSAKAALKYDGMLFQRCSIAVTLA